MLNVYTEWVGDFIGREPNVKTFDGNSRKSKFLGIASSCANFHPALNRFGYNTTLMDDMDEADVITIAAHEAGHYWTIGSTAKQSIIVNLAIFGLLIANLMPLAMVVIALYFVVELKKDKANMEYIAEEFVRKTIGPAMSFNNLMTIIGIACEKCPEGCVPRWNEIILKLVKDALKELEIDYENSDESK